MPEGLKKKKKKGGAKNPNPRFFAVLWAPAPAGPSSPLAPRLAPPPPPGPDWAGMGGPSTGGAVPPPPPPPAPPGSRPRRRKVPGTRIPPPAASSASSFLSCPPSEGRRHSPCGAATPGGDTHHPTPPPNSSKLLGAPPFTPSPKPPQGERSLNPRIYPEKRRRVPSRRIPSRGCGSPRCWGRGPFAGRGLSPPPSCGDDFRPLSSVINPLITRRCARGGAGGPCSAGPGGCCPGRGLRTSPPR